MIPELLTLLDIENSIMLDAMGCQQEIAKQVIQTIIFLRLKEIIQACKRN